MSVPSSIWSILIGVVAVYVLLALLMFLLQGCMVYFPMREMAIQPDQTGMDCEDVYIDTSDGVKINGWWVPADGARGTICMFHGNAGNISHRLESLAIFRRLGYNSFIIDYRGYGRSQGRPSEKGTYRDAEAAWKYLTGTRKIDPGRIVLLGRSMGGAVAAWLAVEKQSAGLVLESAFTSVPDRGQEMYPFLPVRLLARIHYDTLSLMKSVRCPVLVVHSRDDRLIPIGHGRKIFAAANEPKRFLELTGGHNDGFWTSGAVYTDGLREFLDFAVGRSQR